MLEAAYDSTERIVVVRLAKHQPVETHSITGAPGAEFSETLLAWDLSTRTVRWSQSTTNELLFAARGAVVLRASWGNEVLDARTGTRRASLPGRALMMYETRQLVNIENGRARGLGLPGLQPE